MRIGFVELLLILLIASLTIGPSAALWVDRWLRRANRASAAAARRRAVQEAQRAAEREEVLQRFQKLSIVFTLAAVAALVWALVLRPVEAPPKTYTAPDHRQASGAAQAALSTDRREIWDLLFECVCHINYLVSIGCRDDPMFCVRLGLSVCNNFSGMPRAPLAGELAREA